MREPVVSNAPTGTSTGKPRPQVTLTNPEAPLTLEGSAVLHQMFAVDWAAWRNLGTVEQREIVGQAASRLESAEHAGQTGAYAVLGHKADLLVLHFRRSFDELLAAQRLFQPCRLHDYLKPVGSFLSVVELSLYDSSVQVYRDLERRGIQPGSPEWSQAIVETLERQRQAMSPRLWSSIPESRYLCFYPMNRKRGEADNWYRLPLEERRRLMHEHGQSGRKYASKVKQIITSSIGLDDWEWGVDLFADDPLLFKQLIYEMRFDEASARYAEFGPFYVGVRIRAHELEDYFLGSHKTEPGSFPSS